MLTDKFYKYPIMILMLAVIGFACSDSNNNSDSATVNGNVEQSQSKAKALPEGTVVTMATVTSNGSINTIDGISPYFVKQNESLENSQIRNVKFTLRNVKKEHCLSHPRVPKSPGTGAGNPVAGLGGDRGGSLRRGAGKRCASARAERGRR